MKNELQHELRVIQLRLYQIIAFLGLGAVGLFSVLGLAIESNTATLACVFGVITFGMATLIVFAKIESMQDRETWTLKAARWLPGWVEPPHINWDGLEGGSK